MCQRERKADDEREFSELLCMKPPWERADLGVFVRMLENCGEVT